METRRFLNVTHPQMLQGATLLLYLNAAFGFINLLGSRSALGAAISIIAIAGAPAAFLLANDKKVGWYVGLVVSVVAVAVTLLVLSSGGGFSFVINLMFEVLLVVLLLHTASRQYIKIWFK